MLSAFGGHGNWDTDGHQCPLGCPGHLAVLRGYLLQAAGCPFFRPPAWVPSTTDSQPQPGERRADGTQEAKAEGKNSFQFQHPEEEQTRSE